MQSSLELPLLTKADSRSAPIRVAFLGVKAVRAGLGRGRQNLHAADPVAEAVRRLKSKASVYHSLAKITRN
jgi:hypothetical protein